MNEFRNKIRLCLTESVPQLSSEEVEQKLKELLPSYNFKVDNDSITIEPLEYLNDIISNQMFFELIRGREIILKIKSIKCKNVKIPHWFKLDNITSVKFIDCDLGEIDFKLFPDIQSLTMKNCVGITEITNIDKLEILDCEDCEDLISISLENSKKLSSVRLVNCKLSKSIAFSDNPLLKFRFHPMSKTLKPLKTKIFIKDDATFNIAFENLTSLKNIEKIYFYGIFNNIAEYKILDELPSLFSIDFDDFLYLCGLSKTTSDSLKPLLENFFNLIVDNIDLIRSNKQAKYKLISNQIFKDVEQKFVDSDDTFINKFFAIVTSYY